MTEIEKLLSNKDNWQNEYHLIRKKMGLKETTHDQFAALENGASFLFLYAPDDVHADHALALMDELGKRRIAVTIQQWKQ